MSLSHVSCSFINWTRLKVQSLCGDLCSNSANIKTIVNKINNDDDDDNSYNNDNNSMIVLFFLNSQFMVLLS